MSQFSASSTVSGRGLSAVSGRAKARRAPNSGEVPKMTRGVAGLWLWSMLIMGDNTPPILANILDMPIPVCLWKQQGTNIVITPRDEDKTCVFLRNVIKICKGVSPQHCGEYLSSVHIDYSKGSGYTKLSYHCKSSQNIRMICTQKESKDDGKFTTLHYKYTVSIPPAGTASMRRQASPPTIRNPLWESLRLQGRTSSTRERAGISTNPNTNWLR